MIQQKTNIVRRTVTGSAETVEVVKTRAMTYSEKIEKRRPTQVDEVVRDAGPQKADGVLRRQRSQLKTQSHAARTNTNMTILPHKPRRDTLCNATCLSAKPKTHHMIHR